MKNDHKFPVDIVYLWVDGNDPYWLEKKQGEANKLQIPQSSDSINQCRFRDNNELLYSLRSVEKYAPWVNRIFIVTDNQLPKFVNTKRVTIVDHKDIFPDERFLPTFNSNSIELRTFAIKNLSEHFLLLNDDVLFGSPVKKRDFFDENGNPIVWGYKKKKITAKHLLEYKEGIKDVDACCIFTRKLLVEKGFDFQPVKFRHTLRPMKKSFFKELNKLFSKEIKLTLQNNFRSPRDLRLVTLFPLYCLSKQHATFVDIAGINKVKAALQGKLAHIETTSGSSRFTRRLLAIKYLRPKTFCINDDEGTTNEGIEKTKKFLHSLFPKKCRFEALSAAE